MDVFLLYWLTLTTTANKWNEGAGAVQTGSDPLGTLAFHVLVIYLFSFHSKPNCSQLSLFLHVTIVFSLLRYVLTHINCLSVIPASSLLMIQQRTRLPNSFINLFYTHAFLVEVLEFCYHIVIGNLTNSSLTFSQVTLYCIPFILLFLFFIVLLNYICSTYIPLQYFLNFLCHILYSTFYHSLHIQQYF